MTGSTPTLGRRALGRATLARQLLLERADLTVPEALEHLVGLQAQTPHSWYVGLWDRLEGFTPADASTLLADRVLVRLALMRSTLHLVTVPDAVWLRPVVQPVLDRDLFTNQLHRDAIRGVDPAALAERARAQLSDEPRTAGQLGALLQPEWPSRPAATLAYAARNLLPLVQVPPRGLWGRSGPMAHTTLEAWVGAAATSTPGVDGLGRLVERYLHAFGPATVMDVQKWSGLTRLNEIVDRLRPSLVVFRDEAGRELFDLPDAPRPHPDTPAPVRLLYDFDNLLLSHVDRSRVVTDDFQRLSWRPHGPAPSPVLIDGVTAGDWSVAHEGDTATLTVRPYRALAADTETALHREASALLDVVATTTGHRMVRVSSDHHP